MDQTQIQPLILLTASQKQAIRNRPCALCLAMPPLADGGRCHVHRIVRGRDGGQYVAENVVPLCPPCHRAVDRMAALGVLTPAEQSANGQKGAARNAKRKQLYGLTPAEIVQLRKNGHRTHELYPNMARDIGKVSGPRNVINLLSLPKEVKIANARKGGIAVHANKSAAERLVMMQNLNSQKTPEVRRAAGRKAAAKKMATWTAEEKTALGLRLAAAKWAKYRQNGPSAKALAYYARKRGIPVCVGTRALENQLSLDLPA